METDRCYELILNYDCNARCAFCSQGDFSRRLNAPFRRVLAEVLRGRKAGYTRLGLTGGEPLVRGDLLKVVAFAKAAGFEFIRVQTNGIRLADRRFAEALVAAGVTYVKFSLHSHTPEVHDRLLGVPGAWDKAMRGLAHLRELKVRIGVNTVLVRDNYRRLPQFLRFYLKHGVADFVVIYPLTTGSMRRNRERMAVPLAQVRAPVREALRLADGIGLGRTVLLLNVPPCLVPGHEQQVIGTDHFNTVVTDPEGRRWDLDANRDGGREKGPPCRGCALESRCLGVERGYLETFGWGGLKPIGDRPATGVGRPAATPDSGLRTLDGVEVLTDNERCLLELLGRESPLWTAQVLERARGSALCRDCSDGNAVITAGERLVRLGRVRRRFERGHYQWSLPR